ncbi:glycosyltransferase family 4 protein [Priestia megaterium]|uniref:glycosyltransferase family 4 protein n=1 Tax=Priestia megaterium TaxID=1404 RepID=UPI00399017E2
MKKVLILANNDVGLYKFRKELIQQLVKKYKVYISLPYGDFVPNLEDIGCTFIETPISRRGTNPIKDLKLLLHYRKIIRNIHPDVVLTYTIKPNVYGGIISRISNIPYISNITGLGTAVENKGILQKITLFLYKLSLEKAKCVFFQNQENEQFLCNKINIENRIVLPGSGVNLSQYSLLDYPSSDHINFIFVARVMKEKGIDQYLDLAKYMYEKKSNMTFHVLGACEGDYEERLSLMHEEGIINYHGMQSDVKKFYASSHCTIHPTYYPEGMSNVLLESSACGRPIITTDRSGCREVVNEGENGYIVKQQDSQDLIEKVEDFLKLSHESKKEMGLKGRRIVEESFDRNIIVKAYLEEISKI